MLPLRGTPGAPRLGGRGPTIDWVLRMRRFAAGALLSERCAAGTLAGDDVDRLAVRMAAFHDAAPVAAADGPWGTAEVVASSLRDCMARLTAAGLAVPSLTGWIDTQIVRHVPLWTAACARCTATCTWPTPCAWTTAT